MKRQQTRILLSLLIALALVAAACGSDDDSTDAQIPLEDSSSTTDDSSESDPPAEDSTGDSADGEKPAKPLKIGMILVGPQNDRGWSQAHFEAGQYLEEQLGAEVIVVDKINVADSPGTTVEQVVDDLIDQGATLIFATSDDMKDGIEAAAAAYPDIPMVWSSGDSAWPDGQAYRPELTNLANVMGRMEFGKFIAGCAAGLQTQNGEIGYLGPLINDETRRLVNSAFLGAQHCWQTYRDGDPADLEFRVTWIGFWFNIPGVTLDPTQVVDEFLSSGSDVIMSGIDTTEGLVRTNQAAEAGDAVWAVPYDFRDACAEGPSICLGVPYFNWGPAYLEVANAVADGSFSNTFEWVGPDWNDLNNRDTSSIGFIAGDGLEDSQAANLDEFIAQLGAGELDLFTGPLSFQDGTEWLADGTSASDADIWYTKKLLAGIDGVSEAS